MGPAGASSGHERGDRFTKRSVPRLESYPPAAMAETSAEPVA